MAVVHRVQSIKLRFIFPEELGILKFAPVVSTFSNTLDYVNDDEIDRILKNGLIKTETFDASQITTLVIDRPMYQYFYGVAWKLPKQSATSLPIAIETADWII